jgi:hypothetical protein
MPTTAITLVFPPPAEVPDVIRPHYETLVRAVAEVGQLHGEISALEVKDAESAHELNRYVALAKDMSKRLEARRKEIVGPLNETVKGVNALFAPLSRVAEEAIAAGDQKTLAWARKERERVAREQREREEKIREAAAAEEKRQREAAEEQRRAIETAPIGTPTPPAQALQASPMVVAAVSVPPVAPAVSTLRTEGYGTASVTRRWSVEVQDEALALARHRDAFNVELRAKTALDKRAALAAAYGVAPELDDFTVDGLRFFKVDGVSHR